MDQKDFKHCTKIQVRYKDVDKQGHVNNANHLTYFETARVQYFRDVFKIHIDWDKTGLILAHSEITYAEPILMDDDINCYTKISNIGNKSFEMSNILTRNISGKENICAHGKSVLVCFDYITKQTIDVPEKWRNCINEFESK